MLHDRLLVLIHPFFIPHLKHQQVPEKPVIIAVIKKKTFNDMVYAIHFEQTMFFKSGIIHVFVGVITQVVSQPGKYRYAETIISFGT